MSAFRPAARVGTTAAAARGDVVVGVAAALAAVVVTWSWRPAATEVATPIAVLAGAAVLLGLAARRYWAFVLVALASRSAIDGLPGGAVADPASLVGLMFLAAWAIWLAYHPDARDAGRSPLHLGFAAFVAGGAVSVLASASPRTSVLEVARICTAFAMFVIVERFVADPRRRDQVLVALAVSAAVPVLVGLVAVALGISPFETKGEFTRLTSTFAQSNTFARYLAVSLVSIVALHPHLPPRARRAGVLLATGAAVCLVLTYTVGAWVAFAAGVCCVGLLQNRRIVFVTLAAVLAALVVAPGVSERVQDAGIGLEDDAGDGGSFDWRLSYWSEVLPLASANPVTGIGLGATAQVTERSKAPHNDLLAVYVETGLFGLAGYLLLGATAAATARSALRRTVAGVDRGVAVAFAGCCVAFLVASFAANVMRSVALMWWMAALAGLAVAAARRDGLERAPGAA